MLLGTNMKTMMNFLKFVVVMTKIKFILKIYLLLKKETNMVKDGHFDGSDTSTQGDAKYRGEDNRAIFSEITGLSSEEIVQLENDGVLVSRGPSKR